MSICPVCHNTHRETFTTRCLQRAGRWHDKHCRTSSMVHATAACPLFILQHQQDARHPSVVKGGDEPAPVAVNVNSNGRFITEREAKAWDIAAKIAGSTSGKDTVRAIAESLLAFPDETASVKLLARPTTRGEENGSQD